MNNKKLSGVFALVTLAGACLAGCGARSADMYATDTSKLLATKDGEIKACYDAALKSDPKLAGTATVKFIVEADSGVIKNATVADGSTAPESLGKCVTQAIEGLVLNPPDINEGQATFVWEFKVWGSGGSSS